MIEDLGREVTSFKRGDRVIISCVTSCGRCKFCRKSMYSHCLTGGWILGYEIDGTQAEYVRESRTPIRACTRSRQDSTKRPEP